VNSCVEHAAHTPPRLKVRPASSCVRSCPQNPPPRRRDADPAGLAALGPDLARLAVAAAGPAVEAWGAAGGPAPGQTAAGSHSPPATSQWGPAPAPAQWRPPARARGPVRLHRAARSAARRPPGASSEGSAGRSAPPLSAPPPLPLRRRRSPLCSDPPARRIFRRAPRRSWSAPGQGATVGSGRGRAVPPRTSQSCQQGRSCARLGHWGLLRVGVDGALARGELSSALVTVDC
jgi:hypothetical protein